MFKKIIPTVLCSLLFLMMISCTNQQAHSQAEAFNNLGDIYSRGNFFTDAEENYKKATMIEPKKTDIMFKLANTQMQQGKFNEAISTYENILAISPGDPRAHYEIARALMSSGDMQAALVQYEWLLKFNKKNSQALNGMGVLLDHLAQYKLAQTCYQQGLAYTPRDAALLNNLGVSYALNGDKEKAEFNLNKAVQRSTISRPTENLELIKRSYGETRDPNKRQQSLRKALLIKSVTTEKILTYTASSAAKEWCS